MSPFKRAQQVVIPDAALNTKAWLSDEVLARVFSDKAKAKAGDNEVASLVYKGVDEGKDDDAHYKEFDSPTEARAWQRAHIDEFAYSKLILLPRVISGQGSLIGLGDILVQSDSGVSGVVEAHEEAIDVNHPENTIIKWVVNIGPGYRKDTIDLCLFPDLFWYRYPRPASPGALAKFHKMWQEYLAEQKEYGLADVKEEKGDSNYEE